MSLTVFTRTTTNAADLAVAYLAQLMRDLEGDRLTLLTILSQGKLKFTNVLREETRGLAIDDRMIDLVWGWLKAREGTQPEQEREWLEMDARDRRWKQQAADRFLQRAELAAKHGLRMKGDELFDGEKITTGVDDPRLD